MQTWKLQDAKARFSEVIKLCAKVGPQFIMVHGKEEAVILSKEDYEKLKIRKQNFVKFLNSSPFKGIELDIDRDKSEGREVKL